jgi:hypothetical protein
VVNPKLEIVPNYALSVRDVYVTTVKEWLLKERTLDIITTRPTGSKNFDLPSWAPDWTSSFVRDDPLDVHLYHASYGGILDCDKQEPGSVENPRSCCSVGSRRSYISAITLTELKANSELLVLRGIVCGKVENLSTAIPREHYESDACKTISDLGNLIT